jgi:hypothetical protein
VYSGLKANETAAHDGEYRRALKDWQSFVEVTTLSIIDVDETIPELPVKDVIFRIYRDIRFSKDPTPYKVRYLGHSAAYDSPILKHATLSRTFRLHGHGQAVKVLMLATTSTASQRSPLSVVAYGCPKSIISPGYVTA